MDLSIINPLEGIKEIREFKEQLETIFDSLDSELIVVKKLKNNIREVDEILNSTQEKIQQIEKIKTLLIQILQNLIKFTEESWATYPSTIKSLKESVPPMSKLVIEYEFDDGFKNLVQKFIDSVELACEKIRFQETLKNHPDWEREEQIKKNQSAINILKTWRNREISEEQKRDIDEHYEIFKRIMENEKV